MSPMMASARDMSPPAPMPCRARKAASWYIVVAKAHASEPTMNTPMANR